MTENQFYMNSDFFDSNSSTTYTKFVNQKMESLRDNPMLTTASMPIPTRNRVAADFSEFGLSLPNSSNSPHNLYQDLNLSSNSAGGMDDYCFTTQQDTNCSQNSQNMWGDLSSSIITLKAEPSFQMDEDDIFQVDKADLIQGPTLAELNDDTLLEDLNLDDLIIPDETYLYPTHTTLHQLQPVISAPSQLPNQLFQTQNHHSNLHNSGGIHTGIAIGHDVLYDEQTNTSTNSFEMYHSGNGHQTTPNKSPFINLNSSAAFSPGSHNSSSSSLLLNNSLTPPSNNTPNTSTHQSLLQQQINKSQNINNNNNNFMPNNNNNSSSPQCSTLHSLLKKEYPMSPDRSMLGQSVPAGPSGSILMGGNALSPGGFNNRRHLLNHFQPGGGGGGTSGSGGGGNSSNSGFGLVVGGGQNPSRLSSSAPTHLTMDHIWQRREPRQHLLSTGSLAEAGSTSSLSTGSVLSPEAQDLSHDEAYSDDDDSDHYEDYSSDNDSDDDTPKMGSSAGSKKERYFWQYNVQAKGPKGQRLVIKKQMEDPHVLNEITDPVFSPHCSVRGIKHSGKARKGDGNDLTPNPRKLHNIGKELDKLSRIINDMTPVSELPFNVRPKTRKEKNKLASRACRLKKKAQHEANKIKLQGLEVEHRRLLNGIAQLKTMLVAKCNKTAGDVTGDEMHQQLEKIVRSATKLKVAGSSTEFVNKILEKVKAGVPGGGLDEL